MGGLAVQHWTHGAELVPTAGTLPGCLKSGPSADTLQLHVAVGAMGDGEKPGQMCLLGAETTPDPFPVTSFSPNCPPIFTTPRAAQDKLVEMGPCRFGWVLGVT